jgi:hypothetical protein
MFYKKKMREVEGIDVPLPRAALVVGCHGERSIIGLIAPPPQVPEPYTPHKSLRLHNDATLFAHKVE